MREGETSNQKKKKLKKEGRKTPPSGLAREQVLTHPPTNSPAGRGPADGLGNDVWLQTAYPLALCWPGLLTAFIQPSSPWPPSRTACDCGGEQAVLSTLSASAEFRVSQAPVKLSISTRTWNDSVKGGWGLLVRFEARAVLGFRDKTATPQEGESGSGKPALSLIKAGKEGGKGGQSAEMPLSS